MAVILNFMDLHYCTSPPVFTSHANDFALDLQLKIACGQTGSIGYTHHAFTTFQFHRPSVTHIRKGKSPHPANQSGDGFTTGITKVISSGRFFIVFLAYSKIPLSCENTSSLGKRLPSSHFQTPNCYCWETDTSFCFCMGPLHSNLFSNFYIIETRTDSVTECNITILICHTHLNYLSVGGTHGYGT